MFTLDVYGLGYKIFLAVETGIFITAGTLPLIVIVVFFSRTYVFSVLLCIFYGFGWFDVSHLSVKPLHLGVVIGGLIFGLGFGSVGTCPGTCVAGAMTGGFKKAISAMTQS